MPKIGRRHGGQRVEDGDVVDRLLLSRSDPRLQVSSVEVDHEDHRRDPPSAEAPPPQSVPMTDFAKFAEDVIKLNAKNGHWDQKRQRQARSVSNLFVKFTWPASQASCLKPKKRFRAYNKRRKLVF